MRPSRCFRRFGRIFAASELRVSFTVSAVTLAVAIASPVAGSVADYVGRKAVIVPAILGLAIPTALMATSRTLNEVIFWRFCQGLFVPGIIAVMIAYIAEEARPGYGGLVHFGVHQRHRAGRIDGAVGRGGVCRSYRVALCFVLLGCVTFTCGLLVWKWLPDSRHFKRATHPLQSALAMLAHLRNPPAAGDVFCRI